MSENFHIGVGWLLSLAGLAACVGKFGDDKYAAAMFCAFSLAAMPPLYHLFCSARDIPRTSRGRYTFTLLVYMAFALPISFMQNHAEMAEHARRQAIARTQQLDADKKRAAIAREQAQKIAAKKREAALRDKARKQIAQSKAREENRKRIELERKKAFRDIVLFRNAVNNLLQKSHLSIVRKIYNDQDMPRVACLVMSPIWHNRNKHLRKNDAKVFQRLWANVFSPSDPDGAPIRLLSINGDVVGGSRWLGASRVWVEE